MKHFGFHSNQLFFNLRNPTKVKYLHQKNIGNFEVPKTTSTSSVKVLHQQYQDRLLWEKHLNPFGIKQTITSRFKTPPPKQDFVSHEMILARSPKPYQQNQVSFRCSPFLSKPEIKQYLSKIYQLPVQKVETANKMGRLKRDSQTNFQWRKKNWKKAIVSLDYEVDSEFRHFN